MDFSAQLKTIFVKMDINKDNSVTKAECQQSEYANIFDKYFSTAESLDSSAFASAVNSDSDATNKLSFLFDNSAKTENKDSKNPDKSNPAISREVPYNERESLQFSKIPEQSGAFQYSVNWNEDSKNGNVYKDLCGNDASKLDLSKSKELLSLCDFDNYTVFPSADKLPKGYEPQKLIERGKNPGLGIEKLHSEGFTGKGITMAIIDAPFSTNHDEFSNENIAYTEININKYHPAEMHGAAVSSITVGKNVGVAPDANLNYYATKSNSADRLAALNQIIEKNESLPEDKKVQVLSMSWGISPSDPNYSKIKEAVTKLEDKGVFVIYCQEENNHYPHDFAFGGVARDTSSDINSPSSYQLGDAIKKQMGEENYAQLYGGNVLLVPSDRTLAGPKGKDNYTYYPSGGSSWQAPYIAGTYALAKQANPDLKPDEFRQKVLETGTPYYSPSGQLVGKIINPEKLLEQMKAK